MWTTNRQCLALHPEAQLNALGWDCLPCILLTREIPMASHCLTPAVTVGFWTECRLLPVGSSACVCHEHTTGHHLTRSPLPTTCIKSTPFEYVRCLRVALQNRASVNIQPEIPPPRRTMFRTAHCLWQHLFRWLWRLKCKPICCSGGEHCDEGRFDRVLGSGGSEVRACWVYSCLTCLLQASLETAPT